MEKEICVNEYIRTSDGIKRIIKINTGKEATYYGKYILDTKYKGSYSISRKNILKHNENIIELVEIGDYVNGYKVVEKDINFLFAIGEEYWIEEKDIKTILTKEQYEANCYRLEG